MTANGKAATKTASLDMFKQYLKDTEPELFEKYLNKTYEKEYIELYETGKIPLFHDVVVLNQANFYAGYEFYKKVTTKNFCGFVNLMGPWWEYCEKWMNKHVKGMGISVTFPVITIQNYGILGGGLELVSYAGEECGMEAEAQQYNPHLYFFTDANISVDKNMINNIINSNKSHIENTLSNYSPNKPYEIPEFGVNAFIVNGDYRFKKASDYNGIFESYSLTIPFGGIPIAFSTASDPTNMVRTVGIGSRLSKGILGVSYSRSYYTHIFDSQMPANTDIMNLAKISLTKLQEHYSNCYKPN
jgi:hypothetical protein